MKAAFVHGPGDVRIEDVPAPKPGRGEIVLRVEAALVEATDAPTCTHAAPRPLGRSAVGTIEAIGEGVERFAVASRVLAARQAPCGSCERCERGLTTQCEQAAELVGACAESVLVPARIVEANTHALADGMPVLNASLADDLACVLKARDRLPTRPGERAAVVGADAAGLLWTRVLALTGASVGVVDARADRRELAGALGAERTPEPDAAEAEFVVETLGTAASVETALAAASAGGRVLLFGRPPHGAAVELDLPWLHADEITLLACRGHTPYHVAEALRALGAGFVDADLVVRERMALDELPAFVERARAAGAPPKAAVVFPG